ncbi:MAG: hypothetical protein RL261_2440, partial [Pseudomonadota bacterium]
MSQDYKVTLASRSLPALDEMSAALAATPNLACRTRHLGDGQFGALLETKPAPDVLVLHFEPGSFTDLTALAESDPDNRPPVIVVGPAGNAEAVRLAVRSGARDFVPDSVVAAELGAAVSRVLHESNRERNGAIRPDLTVVLGAAGGVGTSFIACNLAHASITMTGTPTLLVDLDVNDAPQASLLDLSPERGLLAALAEVKGLDEHALAGYVSKHSSGLHLMGAPSKTLLSTRAVDTSQFGALMDLVTRRYPHVVIDALHGLDSLAPLALHAASSVVVVMQQSVAQLRQAARLLRILSVDLGVPDSRIFVVVNRYRRNLTVTLDDVQRALARERVSTVPNHYQTVLASIDGGVPVCELD